jgi:hypothetical protein
METILVTKHRPTSDTERINAYLAQSAGMRIYRDNRLTLPQAPEIRPPSGVLPPAVRTPSQSSAYSWAPVAAFLFCCALVLAVRFGSALADWVSR